MRLGVKIAVCVLIVLVIGYFLVNKSGIIYGDFCGCSDKCICGRGGDKKCHCGTKITEEQLFGRRCHLSCKCNKE